MQYIVIQDVTETFKIRDIEFSGHFAIVSYSDGKLNDIYIGNGKSISVGGNKYFDDSKGVSDFYVEI